MLNPRMRFPTWITRTDVMMIADPCATIDDDKIIKEAAELYHEDRLFNPERQQEGIKALAVILNEVAKEATL